MAKMRAENNGNIMWELESSSSNSLSVRLGDLLTVFNHYAKSGNDHGLSDTFILQLLAHQATALQDEAKRQEREFATMKMEIAELKKAVAELKDPPQVTLDKAEPQKKGLK